MIEIRRMTQDDVPEALEIENVCFSVPWSENVYRETLKLPYAYFYIAEDIQKEERAVGIIGLEMIGGNGEISNVAVLPDYRRRGIGHMLLSHVLSVGNLLGNGEFTLEVREGNKAAISLYESFGFRTEGARKHYYDNPDETALIMWKRREQEQEQE